MTLDPRVEDQVRELVPQVLGLLVRRYGNFDACEDALQEALLAAAAQWPTEGVPANPKGWIITVASRRWTEHWRNQTARRRREVTAATAQPLDPGPGLSADDTLTLLFLCCHPSLTLPSQVTLTLRAVGGLNTAEIARALLLPKATVGQRISRAKQRIKASGARFVMPSQGELPQRLTAVLRVLYLIFNEGYTASSGPALNRIELTAEAIRLTRELLDRLPEDGEAAGLLALMLLTDARRAARTRSDGSLVPLAEQDRSLWDARSISEGLGLITETLGRAPIGPYQVQAAIAAVHDEAPSAEETDWPQILRLYDLLRTIEPGPMVTLNRVVAVGMVHGADVGLEELSDAESDPTLTGHYRVCAVRAHLLEKAGDREGALAQYRRAARLTLSVPERRYLESRAKSLGT